MVRTFTGGRPPRNEVDEQEDAQVSEPGLNDFRPMQRNLFVGGAKQDHLSETDDERTPTEYATRPEQFQVPTGIRQRPFRSYNSQRERPERSTEPARTTELEERTRVLEMAMGKILARLIPDDPLIPLLNRDAQPAAPSSSKHSEELMRKNADLERQLRDVQKSIDELKSPRSHQQTLDLDSAPLNLSITAEPYQEGFKIPHLETYDGTGDPDEHLHTYQAIMRIQNANDAMMCKVFPATLKSTARRWYHKLPRHSIDSFSQLAKLFSNKFASQREIKRTATELMQVNQKEGESLRDCMSQILAQIQHWVRRPPPPLHDSPRADKSKHCDYHRVYGHNTEDCQHLKDELEFLARNGKLEGYVQKPHTQQPTQTHFVQAYDRPQGQRYQHGGMQDAYQDNQYPSEQGRAYQGRPFNRRGQGPRTTAPNQKDRKGVGYAGIPSPSGTINMISGGVHFGGQSARGRKTYARQVMTVNKNRPLKRPFEEAEWENTPITFNPVDYKREEGEPDVMMPHVDPFVATVHIGNHNVNKVFVDMGLIYGFDNQPVPVEGIITLPIYAGSKPRFRMAFVTFLVVKMESAFNAILGRAILCELKAVISQPHLCMKFPTPQGVGVLKGNQKMARTCYQDTFKKVELAAAPTGSENHKPTELAQQTMSISDIEHRPKGVEQKAEPVEPVETVPLNPDVPDRTVKIGTKLTEEERAELLKFLRDNQDVFAWTTDEMPGIPAELIVHKLSTDPTRRPVVQKRRLFGPEKQVAIDEEIQKLLQAGFIRRVEYSEWVSNPVLVKKPNGKWRMCIDFTNLNDACPKDPHPLPNVEKLVERAAGHERMSFLDASSGYHQVQLLLDDQEKTAFYAGDAIYCYVMMPFGLKNAGATYQKLVQIIFKLQIGRNIEVYVDDMIVTSVQAEDHIGDLDETFQNLCRAQMKLNPLKCTFAVESGKFLRYVVSKKGIEVNPEKVQAVQQMEPPKIVKDVQRLTGRVAALHRFIAKSAESVELSEYDLKFQPRTTIKRQAIADFLVECISTTEVDKALDYPAWVLYVDGAANIEGSGAGAVLIGPDGFKSEHALRFKFQTTNNAAEYEALIYGLKLASELKVQSIQVFSDSQLMVGQVNGSCEVRDPQLGRYTSVVNRLKSRFASFQIDKIPRADNHRADELSKLASSRDFNPQRSTIVEVLDAPSYTDFTVECQLLSTDPSTPSWTTPLINYLQSGELPEDLSAAKLVKRKAAHFTLLENQLYKRAASMPLLRCLTPYEAEYAVREVHEGVCGTHIGGKTLARKLLRHGYYWPTMVEDAQSYVRPASSMLMIYTCQGKYYHLSRLPGPLLNGFRAAALRSFCNDYGIELALTSVYTPQSNGQAESANKIVLRGLKTRVLAAHSNWVDELNKVLWSCRTTPSSATGETPFSLAYGAEAVIPVEVGLPSDRSNRHDDQNNEQLLRENLDFMEEIKEMSRIRNMAHQSRVAKFYNKRVRAHQFQVGDLVLRKAGLTNTHSHMGKLAPNWEGPYMVVQVKRPSSYVLADIRGRQLPYIWNIQNLRKFYS
ncbi:hypothetical protein SLEP1_g38636 [Rubroshorea leprosula]|uniref:Uncharacterized protein n=1 Tax=Rubroshorea leprosula TaxID=152421 RepID=A0AAV5KY00_9ROSI|nr:hypothetical protein SLEP1_g38636 [Rubroshorea leprosula]